MKALIRIFVFFFIFSVVTVITGYITFGILTSSKNIVVPDLKGKSLLEANSILGGAKLYLKIEGEDYSSDTTSGHIMKQNIPAGNKIKEGRTISVVMSKGPRFQSMSDLRGLTLQKAQEEASSMRLKITKVIEINADSVEKNVVIGQKPSPEEKGGNDMTLIVSKGKFPVTYYCPDFMGKDSGYAEKIAESLGLVLNVVGTGGKVISQSPLPDSLIKKGDIVNIKLSVAEE
ncbi:MAG: PASTA domain-containing protein [Nitrospirae bacterium]|nr:PASTA domain-containing protein [Nitrospirota bacterium]